jgi:hypothetical protein
LLGGGLGVPGSTGGSLGLGLSGGPPAAFGSTGGFSVSGMGNGPFTDAAAPVVSFSAAAPAFVFKQPGGQSSY